VHAKVATEFYVGEGIADYHARGRLDLWELLSCLLEETRQRFAAVALAFVVGAKVEAVHVRTADRQNPLHLGVDGVNVRRGIEAEGDAALIRNNEDAKASLIELGDCVGHAGQEFKVVPVGDVLAFWHFAVDDSVAVEKHGAQSRAKFGNFCAVLDSAWQRVFGLDLHPAMITISG
jgi:hypothetical protein